jgi:fatty acyl-CoA reductase
MVVMRPSIITSTIIEPFQGWTDSEAATGAVIVGAGAGFKHFLHSRKYNGLDVIPVDMVSNALIIASASTAIEDWQPIKIYHVTTSSTNY